MAIGDEAPRVRAFRLGSLRALEITLPEGRPGLDVDLSESERAVLALLLEGCSNREIAARRGTSVRTVANQVASIYRKVGVNSRRELEVLFDGG
ncbi:helix-turn-helix transcriptional regulator [Myxococcota bacterium]|nr:helix-turn-helix transcriptional regulator [Myxococcota bacterium]